MTGWPLSALEVHRHRLVPQRLRLCNDPVNEVAMAAPLRPLVPAADIKVDVLAGLSYSQIHFMSSLGHFYKDDFEMFLSLSSFQ